MYHKISAGIVLAILLSASGAMAQEQRQEVSIERNHH